MKKSVMTLVLTIFALVGITHAQTIVYHENFEAPSGADSVISVSSSSNSWAINTTYYAQGTQSYRCAVQANDTTSAISASFSTLGNNFVILQFKHICKISFYDYAEVFVSTDNGLSWIKLSSSMYLGMGVYGAISDRFSSTSYTDWQAASDAATPTNAWWKTEEFDISSIAANKSSVKIRFRLSDMAPSGSQGAYGWLIDDLNVIANFDELNPPIISLSAPILTDTVYNTGPFVVNALIIDNSGIDTAMLIYTVNAGNPDTLGMERMSGNIFTAEIPSHTYNTTICYYIQAIDSSLNHNSGRYPQTACVSFKVKQPPAVVTIGTGVTNSATCGPVYISSATSAYLYSNHISIFTPAELNASGKIESIAWNKSNTGGYTLGNATYRIYLKHTSINAISATVGTFASELSGATLVYENTSQNLPTTTGWLDFLFNTPNSFTYNGTDNLMVMVFWYRPGNATAAANFYYTAATGKAQTWSSAANPPTIAYSANYRPNVQIGFQITNYLHDVGISQIIEPSGLVIAGSNPIKVYLKNFGTDTLKKADIHYTFNGQPRPVYNWTGSLLPYLSSNSILLGTETIVPGSYNIKAWASLPNDSIDQNHANDTASSSGFSCISILNGSYTVGNASADFGTIDDALSAINLCGMSGPVVFNLLPGVHNTQMTFQNISATSAVNTITFRSSTMNPDDVVIKYNASGTADNYVVYLNGAKNLRFEYLTFKSENPSYGNVIQFNNGASNNSFTGNKIIGPQVMLSSTNICLVYSAVATTSNDSNNVFRLNTFQFGSYGFYWGGPSTTILERGTIIDSNIFLDQYIRAIELRNQDAPVISSNYIYSNTEAIHGTTTTYYYAMYLYYCQNDMKVVKNHIIAPRGVYGIYISSCTSFPGREALFANNFIAEMGGFTFVYGFYVTGGNYQDYLYNSVNITSPTSNAGHAYFLAAGTNIRLLNNIFANTGGAFCVRINVPTAIIQSNYNNLYSESTANWGWWNGAISDFAMWKSACGLDSNSVSMDPGFVSPSDLHVSSIPLNNLGTPLAIVTDDFDGQARSLLTPDIGADEYTPPAKDITIVGVLWPRNSCSLGSQETVELIIRNNGSDPVTSFNAAYKINNQIAVSEAFTLAIPSLTNDTITFTTKADMSIRGLYNLSFYTALLNDENLNNDTVSDYTAFNGHNFYDADFSTSFEMTDPTRGGWAYTDGNNDNSYWHFFGGATNAKTGMIYMGYECNQSNAGNDWFLSRCFTFEANRTYEMSFWYKTSDATYPQSVDIKLGNAQTVASMTTNLISLPNFSNASYIKATTQFSVPVSGVYYFGFYAYSSSVATTTQIMACIDDWNIRQIPPHDAGVVAISTPSNGCGLANEIVKVKIKNFGSSTITSGLTASYKLLGLSAVTENVSGLLLSNDTIEYTFLTPLSLTSATDTLFSIQAYSSLPGDTLLSSTINDTMVKLVKSFALPPPPITTGDSVFSGHSASLSAQSAYPVKWYSDAALNNFVQNGNTYTTPILFNTDTWYATSNIANPLGIVTGNGTSTQYNIPFYGSYDYGWSAVLLKYNQMGYLDSLGWEVGTNAVNYTMPMQKIYMMLVSDSVFALGTKPNPASMTNVFDGTIVLNGMGWNSIKLSTPFFYDPDYSLLVYYENLKGSNVTGYPSFRYTTTAQYQAIYRTQSGTFPNIDGTQTYSRPNMRTYMQQGSGCHSSGVPATAIVTLPQYDAGVSAIISPMAYVQQGALLPISVVVKNYGTEALSSFPVHYKLNNQSVVTQIWTGNLSSGQTDNFTFPSVSIPSGSFVLYAWTGLSTDQISLNDSLLLSGLATNLQQLPYSDNFDVDTLWTTVVSGLTNWEIGSPSYGALNTAHSAPNSWCTNLSTGYNNLADAILTTQTFDFSSAINAQMSFWLNYNTELGLDGLRMEYSLNNGQSWQILGSPGDSNAVHWYNTAQLGASSMPGWSGNSGGWIKASYNLHVFSGMPAVRFRAVFNSNATGTNDGVCIDDFSISIPPALDLALHSITSPLQNAPEGSVKVVQVVIRNNGSTAIQNFAAYCSINQGPAMPANYTGNLLPGEFVSLSLPSVLIPAGFYSICAWVSLGGDAVSTNDTLCVSRYGKPKFDAAITQIISPLNQHSQGQMVAVRALLKNFGVDTLTSVIAGYKIGNNPVVTTTWTGTLYPNAADTVAFPVISIPSGQHFICAFSLLANDFNNLNDTACKMFYGKPLLDISPISIVSPVGSNCKTASEQVSVRLRNLGVDTIKFSLNPVTLSSGALGLNPQTFSPVVINTGQLAPNANQDVLVNGSYDMSVAGVYSFQATASMVNDGDATNNTLGPVSIGGITTISSFPFYENFETGYNSMLRMQANQYAALNVSPTAANGSQYGLHFQGGNPLGWIGEATGVNATTYIQAFSTNSAHVANALSCNIATSGVTSLRLRFDLKQTFSSGPAFSWFRVRVNNQTIANILGDSVFVPTSMDADPFITHIFDLSPWLGTTFTISLQASMKNPLLFAGTAGDNAFVDNIALFVPAGVDAGVSSILQPSAQSAAAGTSIPIEVKIENFGSTPLTSCQLGFISGNSAPVMETWTGTIPANGSTTYLFTALANVYPGSFQIKAFTNLSGDSDHFNDTSSISFLGIPMLNLPWSDDMEGQNFWVAEDAGNSWKRGTPTGSTINYTYNGSNAWVTNLSGNYANNANDYLYSPFFDFSTITGATLKFNHWVDAQANMDGCQVQYSTNNGLTWPTLGYIMDPLASNWYSHNISGTHCWSGQTAGYGLSVYSLTALDNAPNPVRFRFRFFSNASVNTYDGWAVDNFSLSIPQAAMDAGVVAITTPAASTIVGDTVSVQVRIRNHGSDTIKALPISYRVGNNTPISQSWTGVLDPNAETIVIFNQKYLGPAHNYTLCAWTSLPGDTYSFNDTLCKTVLPAPAAVNVNLKRLIRPSELYCDSVIVVVENLGSTVLNSLYLAYSINTIQYATKNWTGVLNPSDSVTIAFDTTFSLLQIPLGYKQGCVKAIKTGDADTTNNVICNIFINCVNSIDDNESSGFALYQNVPNPSSGTTQIRFILPSSGTVEFFVSDLSGRKILSRSLHLGSGEHQLDLHRGELPAGLYFYGMDFKNQRRVKRMVVLD